MNSLIPRPSLAPVFDRLQYAKTTGAREGLGTRLVLKVWSIFPFAIKRILGIKRIFPCSFENKRMRLLTRVYGTSIVSPTQVCTVGVHSVYNYCVLYRFVRSLIMRTAKC